MLFVLVLGLVLLFLAWRDNDVSWRTKVIATLAYAGAGIGYFYLGEYRYFCTVVVCVVDGILGWLLFGPDFLGGKR
jgi:hypothetical protein